MIKIENYAKAYTEILKIIEYLPDSEYQKIPQKLIDQFQEKSDKACWVFFADWYPFILPV